MVDASAFSDKLGTVGRTNYARQAEEAGLLDLFRSLQRLRQGTGLRQALQDRVLDVSLRAALGISGPSAATDATVLEQAVYQFLLTRSAEDQIIGQMTWCLPATAEYPLAGGVGEELFMKKKWVARSEAVAKHTTLTRADPTTVRYESDRLIFALARHLVSASELALGNQADPETMYLDGVMAYARQLHEEKRDPALLRLRDNSHLTLHVLGFHRHRIRLGEWALESAHYLRNDIAAMSILMDDLGWAKYLLRDPAGLESIDAALAIFEELRERGGETSEARLLAAKAHRHKAVILGADRVDLSNSAFDESARLAESAASERLPEARQSLAHIGFARALRDVAGLRVQHAGFVDPADDRAVTTLRNALELLRAARRQFEELGDQGRSAKCVTLEVRVLEALRDESAANRLMPLRDRLLAESVWSRPEARTYIAGRKD